MVKQINKIIRKNQPTMLEKLILEPLIVCYFVGVHLPKCMSIISVVEQVAWCLGGGND